MSQIHLVNLRKEFKDVVAVRDVTITFPTATVTGLLGPSGCGKTTMMRIIAGLERQTAGDVYFDDERVTDLPPRKRKIAMVFQYPVVYRGTSVYRNIELPLIEEGLSSAERKRRIEDVVEILGLHDSIDKDTTQLDIGMRQKVAVARAVARQPKIILFDEPITNVDVEAKVQLKRALKELTKQYNQTIIYVTHDQTEAMTLADQIALMNDGEIVQCEPPRELYNHPNDVFGGWFLGNPGMNFFKHDVETSNGSQHLVSPLFPKPIRISGVDGERHITIGIRPEHVRVCQDQTALSVRGKVSRKFIVVGGQYLLSIRMEEKLLKVKVDPVLGQKVGDEVWFECPFEWITVFGRDGHRLEAELSS
jgi:ABC-type sugar transport system ATPase subunit